MKKQLEYKGFVGSVDYSKEDGCFFGTVLTENQTTVRDLIVYEGQTMEELEEGFHFMIESHLEDRLERKSPVSNP